MVDDGNPTSPYAPPSEDLPTSPQLDDDTQVPPPPPPPPTIEATESSIRPAPAGSVQLPPAGYKIGRMIGRGGMGEVMSAQDSRIGREVAIKRMRNPTPGAEALARFLREARIQARLDHPAIVPVHELGVDESGRPYFTMKRCTGVTLSRMIADGGEFHRMLRAFVDVCLAIDFAHSRGVVHRDIKPANIMLGEYGEVYVLDWGVARLLSDAPDIPDLPNLLASYEPPDPEDSTKSGALLGTPGYIAPEQIEGHVAAPPADVYALGCILFEMLACEPLHPRGQPAIGRTLSTPQDSPAKRRPDRGIPPELDAVCFAALAMDPTTRPTARELADRVQAYLDGDRDVERRRILAAQQLAAAHESLASDDPEARIAALRQAGRAVALDPESAQAAELVGSILLEPPTRMPAELAESLDDHERRINRDRSKKALYAYFSIVALLPLVVFLDVKNWAPLIAFYGVIGLGILSTWNHIRTGHTSVAVALVINLALAVLFSRVASPFVLTPLVIACSLAGITPIPWLNERKWVVVAWAAAAVLLPVMLEWLHVLPKTWGISHGSMVIQSDVFATDGPREEVLLSFVELVFTCVVALLAISISKRRRVSQNTLFVHAWHLRQLIPSSRPWQTRKT
ncbi:MAG: serine/threonine-protein kinase [Kofleriaceae bacterium]